MLVAVFGHAHAHAEALDAVIEAAERARAQELWSLGDMVGGGPDFEHVVERTRARCAVALLGNHDYGATGSIDPLRLGKPGSLAVRSIELARVRLSGAAVDWLRSRKPAARRDGVQCWHGSPRNAVHEYVGAGNAAACLAVQRADARNRGRSSQRLADHVAGRPRGYDAPVRLPQLLKAARRRRDSLIKPPAWLRKLRGAQGREDAHPVVSSG